jgi:hypothetical protein
LEDNLLRTQDLTNVYSLHIHSKEISLFGPSWKQKLISGLNQAKTQSRRTSFRWNALLKSLEGSSTRGKVWLFLGAIPIFQKLRKIEILEKVKNRIKNSFNL